MTAACADEAAFLAAITAAPDDDTPRLVFADWLEEHGQGPRAAFIRRQCEAAAAWAKIVHGSGVQKVPRGPGRPGCATFRGVAAVRPWEAYGFRCVVPVALATTSGGSYRCCVAWHRGFPAVVACTPRQWHRHHAAFPGPLAAVCFSDMAQRTLWYPYLSHDPGKEGFVSRVDRTLTAEVSRYKPSLSDIHRALWPRVREWAGACTLARLESLARGTTSAIALTSDRPPGR